MNSRCGYACPANDCGSTCQAGYADVDGTPANGCETSIQCILKRAVPGVCGTLTQIENVDKFWLVGANGDPVGGMSTNSQGVAYLFLQNPTGNFAYFVGNPFHSRYQGPNVDPSQNWGDAWMSETTDPYNATISFTMNARRGPAGCPSQPNQVMWDVVCSGSAMLGQ